MDKNFSKSFTKCPCCDSPDRFFESLAQELKDAGKADKNFRAYYDVKQGALIDQSKAILLPIGALVPTYAAAVDFCMGCGCLYATELHRREAPLQQSKVLQPPQAPRGPRSPSSGLGIRNN